MQSTHTSLAIPDACCKSGGITENAHPVYPLFRSVLPHLKKMGGQPPTGTLPSLLSHMKCVLHIGTEKTGSTTIQEFLRDNRGLLRRHGILYPGSTEEGNHHRLSLAAYDPTHIDDYATSLGLRTARELVKGQKQIIREIAAELEATETAARGTVIFSSEFFHSRLRTEREVERLRQILEELGVDEVLVIIYLREQSDLVASLYNTAVLYAGRQTPPPEPFKEPYWDNLCDHKASLLRFRKVFGTGAVRPRLFIRDDLVGKDILSDFLDVSKIPLQKEAFTFPPRQNESMSAYGLELLRKLNMRQQLYLEDGTRNPLRNNVPYLFRSSFATGARYRLSPELQERYRSGYAESNEWVRQTCFPERESLFPQKPGEAETSVPHEYGETDQVADLINTLLIRQAIGRRSLIRRILRKIRDIASPGGRN